MSSFSLILLHETPPRRYRLVLVDSELKLSLLLKTALVKETCIEWAIVNSQPGMCLDRWGVDCSEVLEKS